jgi:hypothetical protein
MKAAYVIKTIYCYILTEASMSFYNGLRNLFVLMKCFRHQPRLTLKLLNNLPLTIRGSNYARDWQSNSGGSDIVPFSLKHNTTDTSPNPLKSFFDSHKTGRGIWKWINYFDIYHRHFSKFVGKEVHVLEIGVYSGGSLEMWRDYFGPRSHIYGVDIKEACKCYQNEYTKIYIGDQGDRNFWKLFKEGVPLLDILIDDGGHQTEQQIVTLEEMLPHLRPGGIYLCEDIHHVNNMFPAFMSGIIRNLNAHECSKTSTGYSPPIKFQEWIHSAHFYPYVTVIEKNSQPLEEFIAPKHGTEWQPFL